MYSERVQLEPVSEGEVENIENEVKVLGCTMQVVRHGAEQEMEKYFMESTT